VFFFSKIMVNIWLTTVFIHLHLKESSSPILRNCQTFFCLTTIITYLHHSFTFWNMGEKKKLNLSSLLLRTFLSFTILSINAIAEIKNKTKEPQGPLILWRSSVNTSLRFTVLTSYAHKTEAGSRRKVNDLWSQMKDLISPMIFIQLYNNYTF